MAQYIITTFALVLTFLILSPLQAAQYLELSYPEVNKVNKVNSPDTYFIGNTNPGSKLTINNIPIALNKGLFVKVLPLKEGLNTFNFRSILNNQVVSKVVKVQVPSPEKSLAPKPLRILAGTIEPKCGNIYSPGDIINISFKGSPGGRAAFSLGNTITIPMTEMPPQVDTVKMLVLGEVYGRKSAPIKGIYNGVYEVQPTDRFSQAPVKVHLSDGKGNSRSVLAPVKITTWDPKTPRVAEVLNDNTAVRTGPGDSRLTPLAKGVRLHLTGYEKGYYRYKMGPHNEGYISANAVKFLPVGTPVPFSEIRSMNIVKAEGATYINIPVTTRLPYYVEQTVDQTRLKLYLYGGKADTDIIKYDQLDHYLAQVSWAQPEKNVYALDLLFHKNQQWGYEIYYTGKETDGSLKLVFKIKYPPEVNVNNPLKDKIIAIDPGHGGWEKGSRGFGLIPEKQINLEISKKIAKLLESKGAKPVVVRESDTYMGIYDRPDKAASLNADILISIHNNAIPDGRDPNIEHGSSSYYYHPMGFQLAKSIHDRLLSELKLPDFGLYYDNLALPREHRMPTVLVEIAFMIHPQEYLNLVNAEYQNKSAHAIVDGLSDFFIKTR